MSLFAVVRGSGIPVLILHGLSVDHKTMLPLDPIFERDSQSWERHYVDLPGSGRSRRLAQMNSETVLESVCDYIDSNFGQPVFALVGVSYGGFLARSLHVRYEPHVIGSALVSAAAYTGASVHPECVANQPITAEEFFFGEPVQAGVVSLTRAPRSAGALNVATGRHDRFAGSDLLANYNLEPYPEVSSTELLGGRNVAILGSQDPMEQWREQFNIMDYYGHDSYAVIESDKPHDVEHLIADWLRFLD